MSKGVSYIRRIGCARRHREPGESLYFLSIAGKDLRQDEYISIAEAQIVEASFHLVRDHFWSASRVSEKYLDIIGLDPDLHFGVDVLRRFSARNADVGRQMSIRTFTFR